MMSSSSRPLQHRYRRALGLVIRELRLAKKMTLRDVHLRAAVSLGHLSDIENGQKEVSSEVLDNIARGLDMPLHEVIISAGFMLGEMNGMLTTEDLLEMSLA